MAQVPVVRKLTTVNIISCSKLERPAPVKLWHMGVCQCVARVSSPTLSIPHSFEASSHPQEDLSAAVEHVFLQFLRLCGK